MPKLIFILVLSWLLTACHTLVTQKEFSASNLNLTTSLNQQTDEQQKLNLSYNKLQKQLSLQNKEITQLNANFYALVEELSKLSLPVKNFSPPPQPITNADNNKLILGQAEWVGLINQGLVMPARVDTGAKTSSLHATNLQNFERDGQAWVRFTTHYQAENEQEIKELSIEAPLVRQVKIKQASGQEERPVISLDLMLGKLSQTTEFTLTDRTSLQFPLLLGRSFFMDLALIDVSQSYLQGKPQNLKQENFKTENLSANE